MALFRYTLILIFLTSCSSPRPSNIGVIIKDGTESLNYCPDKPNCVLSFKSDDQEHYLEPIKIISNKLRAHKKITGILGKYKSAKIILSNPNYIHAEFTSSLFQFIDDVEFYFGEDKLVHFRSASRKGHSDLGVNKKRIEEIRFKFQQNDF